MGGIGEYIHLYRAHYTESGTYRLGRGSNYPYNFYRQRQIIQQKMDANTSGLTDAERNEIQTNLSYILSTDHGDTVIANQTVTEIQEAIAELLDEEWGQRMGNIDWVRGDVNWSNFLENRKNQLMSTIRKSGLTKKSRTETFYSRIQEIEQVYSKIFSPIGKQELLDQINDVKTKYTSLFNEGNKTLEELVGPKGKIKTFTNTSATEEQIMSLADDINTLRKAMINAVPINAEKGALFEYVIAALGGQIAKTAEDEVKSTMSRVVGQMREDASIHYENFSEGIFPSEESFNAALDLDGNNVTISRSQGKIDVILNLGNERIANISAKNINLSGAAQSRGVHVMSDSSLLNLLQDQDSDFVNHYLNLAAEHPDGIGNLATQLQLARQVVKQTILWQAVSGNIGNRNTANVFIINDNSKGTKDSIQVFDISQLVQKAFIELEKTKTDQKNPKQFEMVSGQLEGFKNTRIGGINSAEGANIRIQKLLQELHTIKISAALPVSLFT